LYPAAPHAPGQAVGRSTKTKQTPVQKTIVDVAFQPDNIRWQPDGTLFAAGHGGPNTQRVIECLMKVCADIS
jgi:hypothetical protein